MLSLLMQYEPPASERWDNPLFTILIGQKEFRCAQFENEMDLKLREARMRTTGESGLVRENGERNYGERMFADQVWNEKKVHKAGQTENAAKKTRRVSSEGDARNDAGKSRKIIWGGESFSEMGFSDSIDLLNEVPIPTYCKRRFEVLDADIPTPKYARLPLRKLQKAILEVCHFVIPELYHSPLLYVCLTLSCF